MAPSDETLEQAQARANVMELRFTKTHAALLDMVYQFAYEAKPIDGKPAIFCGGLSALEHAFDALGWPNPHAAPDLTHCDEPGCLRQVTSGTPTPNGYRQTCSEHQPGRDLAPGRVEG